LVAIFTAAVFWFAGNAFGQGTFFTGAGPSDGPRVEAWAYGSPSPYLNAFAYESSFYGGAAVATGDVDNDGVPDLVTAAGPGGGPRIRIFNGRNVRAGQLGPFADWFQGDSNDRSGLSVAVGDVNGDGYADVVTSVQAGTASANIVTVWNGEGLRRGS
jgi:hypothetical protein